MQFQIIAKTLTGLEEILAKEIEAIGGINIAIGNRMVSFVGDKKTLYKANLWLRTALRVLKPVERFEASDPDDLYEKVKAIDWTKYVEEGQTIAIDNTIFSENFRNSRYAIYRAKDAICDYFVEHGMKRPKISVASADVQLNLHITDEGMQEGSACTISLDSSGDPLYKRGYKEQQTDAPISEVLAAGVLMLAGWNGTRDLIDPMCGSGTFLVEAALIATNTPAGIYRKGFGFERWTVGENAFDPELWQELYDDDSEQREFVNHIYGSDISKVAIEATEQNIKAAGLSKYITLEQKDFEDYIDENEVHPAMKAYNDRVNEKTALGEDPTTVTAPMIVFNPPYGKRLFTDVPTFYAMVGSALKKGFHGTEAWIISSDDKVMVKDKFGNKVEAEPFDFIGLKPSVKVDLNNGGIVCQLRKFEMFKGKFQDFRAEGNELDKKTADQKDESTKKFTKLEHRYSKDKGDRDGKSFERGDRKPFDKDRKSFDHKDRKPFDKDRKPFDKDRKPFDRDRKPRRTEGPKTERAYEVNEDGTVVAKKSFDHKDRKPFDKDRKPFDNDKKSFDHKDRKPFDRDRKPFDRDKKSFDHKDRKPFDKDRKPFDRKDRKPFDKDKKPYENKKREYDPNHPMFKEDFDISQHVLDFSNDKKD